jgi:hypothetical protein
MKICAAVGGAGDDDAVGVGVACVFGLVGWLCMY